MRRERNIKRKRKRKIKIKINRDEMGDMRTYSSGVVRSS
jgi:hypothetical protein